MSDQEKRYCPYCGHELPPGQIWYCPYCGSSLKNAKLTTGSATTGSPTSGFDGTPRSTRKRPIGVLIIGILSILTGVVLLFLGAVMLAMRVMLTPSLLNQLNSQVLSTYGITVTYSEIMSYSLYMGVASLAMSVFMFMSAAGLLAMKRWGLVLSIIIAGFMTLSSLLYVVVLLDFVFVFIFLASLAVLVYLVRSRAVFR
ncbi:MAG: zinc ribbon domain-containing protein [Thermoprotei archaeon]|nr:zinc ribbon domain-containing protein [TACK group archaeon]